MGDIEKVEFGYFDFDIYPEAIVSDGIDVIIYSYVLDTIMIATTLDAAYLSDTAYALLISDINRDDIPDIAIGAYYKYLNLLRKKSVIKNLKYNYSFR